MRILIPTISIIFLASAANATDDEAAAFAKQAQALGQSIDQTGDNYAYCRELSQRSKMARRQGWYDNSIAQKYREECVKPEKKSD
ncbi:MAG: hypothetical protein GY696_30625 [Gammaproteobacteria bacterium]|nr:hypothetical protein [Gammaproteobacteria bacterium]